MDSLIEQLAEIERQMRDLTLPHSDQQLLDQAWDELMAQLEDYEAEDDQETEDDEDEEEEEPGSPKTLPRPGTPYADEPLELALVLNPEDDF